MSKIKGGINETKGNTSAMTQDLSKQDYFISGSQAFLQFMQSVHLPYYRINFSIQLSNQIKTNEAFLKIRLNFNSLRLITY